MMKLRNTLYAMLCLTAGLCTLTGCIDEYEADIHYEDTDLLVVEGTICSGQTNRFYLSHTQALNSFDMPRRVSGAIVSVRGTDGSEYPTSLDNGCYFCQLGQLSPDVEYYLHIEYEDEIYESTPQKPLPSEGITQVKAVQNFPRGNIDVLVTPEEPLDPGVTNYYSWTYDETYEVRPEYETTMYFDVELGEPVYEDIYHFPPRGWIDGRGTSIMVGASTGYEGEHIQGMKIYGLSHTDSKVYYMYSGLVHQRAISKGEYEYELARRQASSEMGGLFTPLPSALPTNIRCLTSGKRVIGYIGCSLNTSDFRFFINASEFTIRRYTGGDNRVWLVSPTVADCCAMVARGMYLVEWLIPEMTDDNKLHTAWAYLHQLDVRARYSGAYVEKPGYWPE